MDRLALIAVYAEAAREADRISDRCDDLAYVCRVAMRGGADLSALPTPAEIQAELDIAGSMLGHVTCEVVIAYSVWRRVPWWRRWWR